MTIEDFDRLRTAANEKHRKVLADIKSLQEYVLGPLSGATNSKGGIVSVKILECIEHEFKTCRDICKDTGLGIRQVQQGVGSYLKRHVERRKQEGSVVYEYRRKREPTP